MSKAIQILLSHPKAEDVVKLQYKLFNRQYDVPDFASGASSKIEIGESQLMVVERVSLIVLVQLKSGSLNDVLPISFIQTFRMMMESSLGSQVINNWQYTTLSNLGGGTLLLQLSSDMAGVHQGKVVITPKMKPSTSLSISVIGGYIQTIELLHTPDAQ